MAGSFIDFGSLLINRTVEGKYQRYQSPFTTLVKDLRPPWLLNQ